MPTIVISAVNLVEGGTLKVFQDCLRAVRSVLPEWRVVALVNNINVTDVEDVELIAMPESKRSWIRRVYTEYFGFRKLSKQLEADIWWSLHDMSPIIRAKSQFVYCHNPSPLYQITIKEILLDPSLFLFCRLYFLFYRINIRSNRAVIVQQNWLRKEFKRRFGVTEVIVAHPVDNNIRPPAMEHRGISVFVYPSLSRTFKNFELIGEAARILERDPNWKGRIILTLDPQETRLSRYLFRRYGDIRCLEFIGRQKRSAMQQLYSTMDCLLFPSRLETWGLPITETKELGKPIIAADLPYAHETIGDYDRIKFVDPGDPRELARIMLEAHRQGWASLPVKAAPVAEPFATNWASLVKMIVTMHEQRPR